MSKKFNKEERAAFDAYVSRWLQNKYAALSTKEATAKYSVILANEIIKLRREL